MRSGLYRSGIHPCRLANAIVLTEENAPQSNNVAAFNHILVDDNGPKYLQAIMAANQVNFKIIN